MLSKVCKVSYTTKYIENQKCLVGYVLTFHKFTHFPSEIRYKLMNSIKSEFHRPNLAKPFISCKREKRLKSMEFSTKSGAPSVVGEIFLFLDTFIIFPYITPTNIVLIFVVYLFFKDTSCCSDQIRTLVAMATYTSHRLIMEKSGNCKFLLSHWRYLSFIFSEMFIE